MEKVEHYILLSVATMVGMMTAMGMFLSTAKASADSSAVSTASITVPVACTMRGTGVDSHTATIAPNTYSGASGSGYENGIGKTTLTAICNDDNGFSIYAIGYTNNQYEGENHTKLVGQSTSSTIATKAYANGDTTSNWSMKLTKVTDSTVSYNPQNLTISSDTEGTFSNWHSIPNTYTKVAEYHANTGSSTTDTTLGVKLETTYAAFIAANQPADTYTGQVKYTMVHPYNEQPLQPQPSTAGCITYYANASDSVGTMGIQCNVTGGSNVTLYASNFSRTGYGFAGWSDKFDYATNNSAHFYGPNETITAPEGTTANGLSLYAVWIKAQGSLQDSSKVTALCGTNGTGGTLTKAPTDGSAKLSSVTALTDERDNQTYAIAKLADGNCWMIENLRLENTAQHNTDGSLTQGYNSSFIGLATPESADFSDSTTANSLYSTDGTTDATISGSDQGYRFPRYNNFNTQQRATNTTNTNINTYSDGNYYTWHAAIADTTYYSSGDHGTTSICPTGWRLPQGNTTSAGFGKLDVEMGGTGANQSTAEASNRWRKYPANFLYSGNFKSSSAYNRGNYGYYWSSTASNIIYYGSYELSLDSSNVNPGKGSFNTYFGNSIRCTVADS